MQTHVLPGPASHSCLGDKSFPGPGGLNTGSLGSRALALSTILNPVAGPFPSFTCAPAAGLQPFQWPLSTLEGSLLCLLEVG